MSEELDYAQLSYKEHVIQCPDMYLGGPPCVQTLDMYILDKDSGKFILTPINVSLSFLKIYDEILVNAVDNHTRYPSKVRNIDITFVAKKGQISIRNDGPGIPIKKVDTLHDGKKYQAEAIFSQPLSGSNFKNTKKIVGGKNGTGAKLTNIFSKAFKVETVYGNKKYKQIFRDRLDVIEEPEVSECDEKEEYTKISFIPDYASLGYKKFDETVAIDIYKLLEARAYQIAAFVKCNVTFNKNPISVDNFKTFSEMFILNDHKTYNTILVNPDNSKLNLELTIGISDGKFRQVSLINGIDVFMGGSHIKYIQSEIIENLKKKVEKELSKTKHKYNNNFILNNLFLFVKGHVEDAVYNSQAKEKLTNPVNTFENYKFKTKEWKEIWDFLEPHIMSSILGKIKDKGKNRVNRGKVILDKGDDAKYAGDKKKAVNCTLIICEGDSALALATRGINHKKTPLEKDYYGTFSIQGVPPNCRKLSSVKVDIKTGEIHKIRNEKLKNNKRFSDLVKILGLDYDKTYDKETKEGQAEFKTLRYGRVVVAVDQDEDGKGQIFGLLINFFMFFWPKLADWGYIKRFNTPIIRAYPKSDKKYVREFGTLYSYSQWIQEEYKGDDENASKDYNIKYYKGLATHTQTEVCPMFNSFENKLYTYDYDAEAEDHIETYYGENTTPRKKALSCPVSHDDEIKEETVIPISRLMRTDVKEFQLDNISRKLPHIMDGLVPARRKTLCAARDAFKSVGSKEIKVCNFAGVVMSNTNYHHGDASLSKTIVKMAQNFVGARNLPLLIGIGEFGSRIEGGDDAGQPRYISVKLNNILVDALFPKIDDFLLKYVFDEGERCEPLYYVPVLPLSILEYTSIPATGWKSEIWPRDYKYVIRSVRDMIKGDIPKCRQLPIWLRGNNSDVRYGDDGNFYLVGKYTYDTDKNVLTVTELPPSVFNKSYIKSVAYTKEKTFKTDFKDVIDYSNYDEDANVDEINIQFELNPEVMEKWEQKNDSDSVITNIEKKMNLSIKVSTSNINMIKEDGSVGSYKKYTSIVNKWFPERKRLYSERITRLAILTGLKIKYLENIIRFTKERDQYNINNKTPEEKFNEILIEKKYDTFNKALLFSPKYTAIEDLENLIMNNPILGTNYEYIISLTYRQLLKESCKKRKEELQKEKETLKDLQSDMQKGNGKFIGQKTWLRELEALESIIDEGINKGWVYKKNKPKFKK